MLTACKFCYFAVYDKNTQTGCSLGKLDKFRANGHEIIEAYDEEKEFYLIKGFCPFFRTGEWAKDKVSPVYSVMDETKLNYHVIVKYDPQTFEKINSLLRTQASYKPNTLSILTDRELEARKFDLRYNNWKIVHLVEGDYRAGLDSLVATVNDPIYIYIDNIENTNLLAIGYRLHSYIVEELKPFLAATCGKNYICTKSIHNEFGGNMEKPLIEKLKDKGLKSQILNINDL